jgi:hypothetical protein
MLSVGDVIDKVQWALLFHKRHLKKRGLLKAYKAHNPSIPWQCGTLNTPPHVWHYCPNTCTTGGKTQHCPRPWSSDTMIKSSEPYSSTKGTLRKEVCSRLIKPTTQAYLGNVRLLTVICSKPQSTCCFSITGNCHSIYWISYS